MMIRLQPTPTAFTRAAACTGDAPRRCWARQKCVARGSASNDEPRRRSGRMLFHKTIKDVCCAATRSRRLVWPALSVRSTDAHRASPSLHATTCLQPRTLTPLTQNNNRAFVYGDWRAGERAGDARAPPREARNMPTAGRARSSPRHKRAGRRGPKPRNCES
jgi:hypothetical protein